MNNKIGLKLWSTNTDFYLNSAIELYKQGIFDFIELYVVTGSLIHLPLWKKVKEEIGIPFVLHAPHFMQNVNLAKAEYFEFNKKAYEEVEEYRKALDAEYTVVHGGIEGDIEETVRQLKIIKPKNMLIENKPYKAPLGDNWLCRGYNPEEIKYVMDEIGCGFCLDIGHAICTANSLYDKFITYSAPSGGSGTECRRGLKPYIKEFSRTLRKNMTIQEIKLWRYIRKKQLGVRFRRQVPIDDKYIADFADVTNKIIIELDGGQHCGSFEDVQRTFYLEQNDYKIIRFWNNEVDENIEGCLEMLKAFIAPYALRALPPEGAEESLNEIESPYALRALPPEGAEVSLNHFENSFALQLSNRIDFVYNYLSEFNKLNPTCYHLSDGEIGSPVDMHLHIGEGDYDFKRIFDIIDDDKNIAIETKKNSKENLNDFKGDVDCLKTLL